MRRVNALDTLRLWFDQSALLFALIREIDQSGGQQIPEHVYLAMVRRHTQAMSPSDQDRLQSAFAPDNLLACGLLIDRVPTADAQALVFQPAFIQTARLGNASLLQDLTDAKLGGFLVSARDLVARLNRTTFDPSDPDYCEVRDALMQLLAVITGALSDNLRRMEQLKLELAEQGSQTARGRVDYLAYRQALFERIQTLYLRHIRPTLQFLNPDAVLADGDNLSQVLKRATDLLDSHGRHEFSDQVARTRLSLNQFFEPISQVEKQVVGLMRRTQRTLKQAAGIEQAFHALLALKEDAHSKNLKTRLIKRSDWHHHYGFLAGIHRTARPRVQQFGQSPSYYRLFSSEVQARLRLARQVEQTLPELTSRRQAEFFDQQRQMQLLALLDATDLRPTDDVHRLLHERLLAVFPDYQAADLITALRWFDLRQTAGAKPKYTNRRRHLEQAGRQWRYSNIQLIKDSNHDSI